MCDRKGCELEGRNVPKVVITVRDRVTRQKWTIPAIAGLRICDDCKQEVTDVSHVLADGGEMIVRAVLGMRRTARLVSKKLAWTTVDSEDFKLLQKARPS